MFIIALTVTAWCYNVWLMFPIQEKERKPDTPFFIENGTTKNNDDIKQSWIILCNCSVSKFDSLLEVLVQWIKFNQIPIGPFFPRDFSKTDAVIKNAFYFTLKAAFVPKTIKFLSWLFSHVEKNGLIRKIRLNLKFMTSQPG